jgi:hypothetical protein
MLSKMPSKVARLLSIDPITSQDRSVHCLAVNDAKTQIKNIIVRPLGPDRAAMGRSFEDLKNYQRCP